LAIRRIDHTAAELREAATRSNDADATRRMLALALDFLLGVRRGQPAGTQVQRWRSGHGCLKGRDMVTNTLRMVDANVPVRAVRPSRGKIIRAEPISALYEQNRVSHVGGFDMLEDQLCSFQSGSTDSPDRLDVIIYAPMADFG
jgi:hypothetical protein